MRACESRFFVDYFFQQQSVCQKFSILTPARFEKALVLPVMRVESAFASLQESASGQELVQAALQAIFGAGLARTRCLCSAPAQQAKNL